MSRKSERLQTKRGERSTPAILNRKRKSQLNAENNDLEQTWEIKNQKMEVEHQLLTPTDDCKENMTWSRFRTLSSLPVLTANRRSPLPKLYWADSQEVWDFMIKKDLHYKRDSKLLGRHPCLQANMRSILLDWLIEVCEVYRLHRDSYYLALDYVDRFLATQTNVPKQHLQLIGITALFLAAKVEEIYPPKLTEFAYVTDGACTEDEILDKELVIMKALNWDLSPITVYGWINIFLQLACSESIEDLTKNFVIPHYSGYVLVQVSRLIDLCMLDIGSLRFSYSIIATSALCHVASYEMAFKVSGYKLSDIYHCVQWMSPFAITTKENGPVQPKFFQQISEDDMHNIQTHDIDLELLEDAQSRFSCMTLSVNNSPVNGPNLLTPPKSHQKVTHQKQSDKCEEQSDRDDDDIPFIVE